MTLEWEQELPFITDAPLALVADCCGISEGARPPLAAHLLLVSDERIRAVNAARRGVDRATDVLSFPMVNYPKGKTARDCDKRLRAEYDPELGACMLGDVMISVERAQAQAQEYGHGVERELCYLLAHGLFHLMGYDHVEPDDQKEMRAMEEKALHMAGMGREESGCPDDEQLLELARVAMKRSYSPYSRYPVGAALLCRSGRVYLGCNIENASFGLSNCAERTALFKAVSEGERAFSTIAIASERSAPYPCGACRQALNEFAPELRVLVTWDGGRVERTTLGALLPHGFGPEDVAE